MSRYIRAVALFASAVALFPLAACGNGADDASTRFDSAAATSSALQVAEVDLGRAIGADKRITAQTNDFRPTDTVYVSVVTQGNAQQAQLTARWTYQDGQVVDESSQTIAPSGTTVTEFHVSRPSGWPAGKYTVRILLDGREVESEEFDVQQ